MLFIAQLVSYFCTIAIKCHFSAAVDRFRMAWGAKFCAQPRAFGTFNPLLVVPPWLCVQLLHNLPFMGNLQVLYSVIIRYLGTDLMDYNYREDYGIRSKAFIYISCT